MISKLVFEVLGIIEVVWSELASKVGKTHILGTFRRLVPVQPVLVFLFRPVFVFWP